MAKINDIYDNSVEIFNDFKRIELNAIVLTRYASPSKANLSLVEDYHEHYFNSETELVLDLVSEDLLAEIKDLKKKLEELKDNLCNYCYGNDDEDSSDIVVKLNKLID